jgi:hypothetical protein
MADDTPLYLTPTNLKFIPTKERRRRRRDLRNLRPHIRRRDGGRCVYCGAAGQALDHILPHSKGGPDTLENLVLSCVRCNSVAGAKVFNSLDAKREYILARRPTFDADPQNRILSICCECYDAYRPRVGEATVFLCQDCMELQNDERSNRRTREDEAPYLV